jgi:hypothetical protein
VSRCARLGAVIAAVGFAGAGAGCVPDSDPRWQLNHDRVVAARATPPHLPAGTTATIDALIAHAGAPTTIEAPVSVMTSPGTPASLATVTQSGSGWQVTAAAADALDAARTTGKIPPGQPIPLVLIETFGPIPLTVSHTIFLGDAASNPPAGAVQVAGAATAPDAHLVIPRDVDAPLSIDADPTAAINWLTSCGTMHDDDERAAFVHVQPDDSQAGELVVVVRATDGGVGWQRWTIEAQ